jgi:hypothetical protein
MKKYWHCMVGPIDDNLLPPGADSPPRRAAMEAINEMVGNAAVQCWSGWCSENEHTRVTNAKYGDPRKVEVALPSYTKVVRGIDPRQPEDSVEAPHKYINFPTDAAARKGIPIITGVLDYFPDAIADVAKLSKVGNDQHNPGQPLHWSRGKSNDHADTLGRHLAQRGTLDSDGVRHSAKVAWRALALLQLEIEADAAKGKA